MIKKVILFGLCVLLFGCGVDESFEAFQVQARSRDVCEGSVVDEAVDTDALDEENSIANEVCEPSPIELTATWQVARRGTQVRLTIITEDGEQRTLIGREEGDTYSFQRRTQSNVQMCTEVSEERIVFERQSDGECDRYEGLWVTFDVQRGCAQSESSETPTQTGFGRSLRLHCSTN